MHLNNRFRKCRFEMTFVSELLSKGLYEPWGANTITVHTNMNNGVRGFQYMLHILATGSRNEKSIAQHVSTFIWLIAAFAACSHHRYQTWSLCTMTTTHAGVNGWAKYQSAHMGFSVPGLDRNSCSLFLLRIHGPLPGCASQSVVLIWVCVVTGPVNTCETQSSQKGRLSWTMQCLFNGMPRKDK